MKKLRRKLKYYSENRKWLIRIIRQIAHKNGAALYNC